MNIIKAQIIKAVGGDFTVKVDTQVLVLKGRKKLKGDKLFVGDFVEIDEKQGVIESLIERQNFLVRPPLANVEQAIMVVAPIPKPDYFLIDKLLVKFFSLNIKPVIVMNKIDICASGLINELVEQYGKVCEIYMISALDYQTTATTLNPVLTGKFSILTGQSAVGKSSILNCLLPDVTLETGGLSRIGRGRNTTRHSEIFMLENGALIADTPGFNAFELDEFSPEDIIDNYPEFKQFSNKCKFNNCNHIKEKTDSCAVKRAVESGEMNKLRYERYVKLYEIASEKEKKQYG
ncbi:MAG: ribosome small subunit-dependent GTPase A [Clostridia bacterium]|nr:ribosome small subunit-dependent GTPase A [Clostridia bacterium]